jgi:hypothetical protein
VEMKDGTSLETNGLLHGEDTGTGILRNTSSRLFNELAIHRLCCLITTPCH